MVGTQPGSGSPAAHYCSNVDWRKRMSNQVAYALLVYTGLQIFLTMGALQGERASMLPYVGLVLLVGAIIPACRNCDRRWQGLSEGAAHDPEMERSYRRDRRVLWALALGVPLTLTGLLKLLAYAFAG
jgi:hypothetical protein